MYKIVSFLFVTSRFYSQVYPNLEKTGFVQSVFYILKLVRVLHFYSTQTSLETLGTIVIRCFTLHPIKTLSSMFQFTDFLFFQFLIKQWILIFQKWLISLSSSLTLMQSSQSLECCSTYCWHTWLCFKLLVSSSHMPRWLLTSQSLISSLACLISLFNKD